MGRKIPVLDFESKAACKAAVRAEVDPYRQSGAVFYSELVARLFRERHYALAPLQISPIAFQWRNDPSGSGLKDWFFIRINDARFPRLTWREASWNKCIDGWRLDDETLDAELADQYRRYALQAIFAYRNGRALICEYEGCTERDGLDVHHVSPTFKVIATEATALLTPAERAELIAAHDWFSDHAWPIPQKCTDHIERAHELVEFKLLCKRHHYAMGRKTS